jgi:hypothetical protein
VICLCIYKTTDVSEGLDISLGSHNQIAVYGLDQTRTRDEHSHSGTITRTTG